MPNSITTVTADKYDDIVSGEPVRVAVVFDADTDGILASAVATTPGFDAAMRPAKDVDGPIPIMKGSAQMLEVWLVVKRGASHAENCTVALRVGDSNPFDLPFGVRD